MWGTVDEVGPGDQCSGEADHRAVESGYENLWMCVERIAYVEVVGNEGGEPVSADVSSRRDGARHFDICSTAQPILVRRPHMKPLQWGYSIELGVQRKDRPTRRRSAPFPSES